MYCTSTFTLRMHMHTRGATASIRHHDRRASESSSNLSQEDSLLDKACHLYGIPLALMMEVQAKTVYGLVTVDITRRKNRHTDVWSINSLYQTACRLLCAFGPLMRRVYRDATKVGLILASFQPTGVNPKTGPPIQMNYKNPQWSTIRLWFF
jgi:hypothetical protein